MTTDAERAEEMAKKKFAKESGVSQEAAAAVVNPAIKKCAAIASELTGREIPADMDALMALGPEMMTKIQARLEQMTAAKKEHKSDAAFTRAPKKNPYV